MKRNTVIIIVLALVAGSLLIIGRLNRSLPSGSYNDWVRGDAGASITLIEYADFQCPACAVYHTVVKQLGQEFPNDLKIIMRHFPLTQIHNNAFPAAQATEAAGKQGKFWEMHDMLYEHQDEWARQNDAKTLFTQYARTLDLDLDKFANDFSSREIRDKINSDNRSGLKLGITGTPTFIVNDQQISNPKNYEEFKSLIQKLIRQLADQSQK